MEKVPAQIRPLLNLIVSVEAGPDDPYNVVYGHHEHSLPKPITAMTLAELMANQAKWGKQWGSSAAGAYQIMPQTLAGLIHDLGLSGNEKFTPDLQDAFAYQLLVRRGLTQFLSGQLSTIAFGKALAQEWASFPVLADTQGAHRPIVRGQSYYAGDGLNKALLKPETVENMLSSLLLVAPPVTTPAPSKPPPVAKPSIWQTIINFILSLFGRKTNG